jgi:hypothetical protein
MGVPVWGRGARFHLASFASPRARAKRSRDEGPERWLSQSPRRPSPSKDGCLSTPPITPRDDQLRRAIAAPGAVYPRRSFHWPRSRRANRSLISPMTLAPSREPWTAGELMSELWAVVRAPCTSSTVRMFFRTKRSRMAIGDRSADHGRSERATEGRVRHDGTPQKNVRSTSLSEAADTARDGSHGNKKIAPTRNASARAGARPHPSP